MQIDVEIQEEKIKKNIINEKLSAKNKKWEEKRFNYETQSFFIKKLNLNPIIAKILVNRQITEKNLNKFIDPTIKEIMPDPQLIDDMKKATNKIVDFILKKKKNWYLWRL
mgnify:CR=1 FL=1